MTLHSVRVAAVVVALVAVFVAVLRARAVAATLRTFFLEPSSAINLGALRILIFWTLFESSELGVTAKFARLPSGLRRFPYGWDWLRDIIPFGTTFASQAQWLFLVSSALAAIGLCGRISVPLAALSSVYVLGIPNFFSKINHSNHALTLCALILAVAPCSDALSIDRGWRRWRGEGAVPLSVKYTVPVRFCWLVLGTVYLFPGLWKLWISGDLWIDGVQLKALLYGQWGRLKAFEPLARIDRSPFLLSAFGIGTLVFEIGFIFALFHRWTRVLFAVSAIAFHWSIWKLMGIYFHLGLPLMLLFDYPALYRWLGARTPAVASEEPSRRSTILAAAVGSVLFSAQVAAGFAGVSSWPISVYPRFEDRKPKASASGTRTLVMLESAGSARDLSREFRFLGKARLHALIKKTGRIARDPDGDERISALLRGARVRLRPGDRVAIYRERWDLFPLGTHKNRHRKLVASYRVTNDGTVTAESVKSHRRRGRGRK